eukprot:CAMPEP_0175040504 /NCGR_PEP_ID=MMETSP0052_2-20121109/1306_1 /TAXON_ID=51329 ORGANISM="Polytomella parva, Strain SAG 63-3" /NCGR_SAMPLE_ID=MMETSP0052_2 /ASSEMBLY_ACC=CAM_ASM_000194 /LENGTH=269 /DNA_ID=CAMNT_0016302735 /DNA_START=179 /DNA_END=985 /DNA_ORIENTATION=-
MQDKKILTDNTKYGANHSPSSFEGTDVTPWASAGSSNSLVSSPSKFPGARQTSANRRTSRFTVGVPGASSSTNGLMSDSSPMGFTSSDYARFDNGSYDKPSPSSTTANLARPPSRPSVFSNGSTTETLKVLGSVPAVLGVVATNFARPGNVPTDVFHHSTLDPPYTPVPRMHAEMLKSSAVTAAAAAAAAMVVAAATAGMEATTRTAYTASHQPNYYNSNNSTTPTSTTTYPYLLGAKSSPLDGLPASILDRPISPMVPIPPSLSPGSQ